MTQHSVRLLSRLAVAVVAATLTTVAAPARASEGAPEVGKPAPAFTLPDLDGKKVSLADFKGKRVVLEWFNPECPFVKYAHTKGPLADQGNAATADGVIWLAINSGAPGKQGHGVETNQRLAGEYGIKYPVLLDEDGAVGRAYGARTTPHMFVIDGNGTLAYMGAIDNAPLGDAEGGTPLNYVAQALTGLAAGKPIQPAATRSYGCSVKYAK